jgi:hypothetical protein
MRRNGLTIILGIAAVVLAATVYAQSDKGANPSPTSRAEPRYLLFQGSYVPLGTKVPLPPEPQVFKIDTQTGRVWTFDAGLTGENGAYVQKWTLVGN